MLNPSDNLGVCHRCEHSRGCNGRCPCRADPQGRDIVALAKMGGCPRGLFGEPPFTHESPVEEVMTAMAKPLPPNVSGTWYKSDNAQEAMRRLMRQAAENAPELPDICAARGIVIAGGGKYFDSAYVVIRMLRHLGCTLPIQLWYLGSDEIKPWQRQAVEPHGVELVDAYEVAKARPARKLSGWEMKPYAIVHSPFAEVLFLDADSIPLRDPTFLFDSPEYIANGALFWPDQPCYDLKPAVWEVLGLPFRDEPAFESGQIVIDKRRCWRAINLALWMNEHSDFYYKHVHGDKETFHLAWRYLGLDYAMPKKRWRAVRPAMIQHDFAGKPLFAHRSTGKFTLNEEQEATQYFKTTGQYGPSVRYNPAIPLEDVQWGFLRELGEFRDSHEDHAATFTAIYQHDEWGGGSGSGSRPDATDLYRRLLQTIVKSGRVCRIVDLGCGDWQFSKLIDWSGIEYVGVDVVPSLIEANTETYGRENIRFRCADLRQYVPREPPDDTLYVVKDVLQHWTRGQIKTFLQRFAGRDVLITNTAEQPNQPKLNTEIETGGFRPLDITAAPFNQPAELLLDYTVNGDDRKKTLLVYGDNSPLRAIVPELKELWRPLAVVQLGRNGDMLTLLPALKYLADSGRIVHLITRKPYDAIFRGQDWLTVHPVDFAEEEWEKAREFGLTLAGECRVSQVGHVKFTPKHPHWALEEWHRLGVPMDLFDALPLDVTRDPTAEAEIVRRHVVAGPSRPIILYNGTGYSSPFDKAAELLAKLREHFKGCHIIDLSEVRAGCILDLLGLYERAALIVSSDTATLHLGRVLSTPTIALVRDEVWGQSPNRSHWKLRISYTDSLMQDGFAAIREATEQVLAGNLSHIAFARKAPVPAIPLAGDVVERLAKAVGADKLAAAWERLTGRPCGCQDRKAWLNQKSRELLKMFGMT